MSYAAKFTNHVEIADDLDVSGGGLRIEGTHSTDSNYSLITNNHLKIQTDDNHHLTTGNKSESVNSQTESSSYIDLTQNSSPFGATLARFVPKVALDNSFALGIRAPTTDVSGEVLGRFLEGFFGLCAWARSFPWLL